MRQGNQSRANRQGRGNRNDSSGQSRNRANQDAVAGSGGRWSYDERDRGQQEQYEPQQWGQGSEQRNFGTGRYEGNRDWTGNSDRGSDSFDGGYGSRDRGDEGADRNQGGGYGQRDLGSGYGNEDRNFGGSYGQRNFGSGYGNQDRNPDRSYGQRNFGGGDRNLGGDYGSRNLGSGYGRNEEGFNRGFGNNNDRDFGNQSGSAGPGSYGRNEPTSGGNYGSDTRGFGQDRNNRVEGRGPKNYRRSDERIREEVCERLMQGGINAEEVDVQVKDGQVTLAGTVENRQDKREIEDLADEVLGVKEVQNQLRVQKASSFARSDKSSNTGGSSNQTHGEGSSAKSSKS
jgi:predicted amino acid-binding ACT domain protein